jgi:Mn2+/Fe2+ NRAMP family transporter
MAHSFHSLLFSPIIATILVLILGLFLVNLNTSGILSTEAMIALVVVVVLVVPGLSLMFSHRIFPSKHAWKIPNNHNHTKKKEVKPHERTDSYWYHDD